MLLSAEDSKSDEDKQVLSGHSPVGEHQSSIEVERIPSVHGQIRALRLWPRSRSRMNIAVANPVVPWLGQHAAPLVDIRGLQKMGNLHVKRLRARG